MTSNWDASRNSPSGAVPPSYGQPVSSPSRPVTVLEKDTVLPALFGVWDDIDRLLITISEAELLTTQTELPGWHVRDVVAHIIGTELMLKGEPVPEADIEVSELDHVHNPIGVMNECWVRSLGALSSAELLEKFRAVTGDRRATLTAMSDDEWNTPTMTPAGQDSLGRFMRIRTFDSWMHEQDIRESVARPAPDVALQKPEAQLSLDEIETMMGFVVAKRGGAPDGSRVAIELTGPMARTIRVAVDGRAAVVPDFGGAEPTTVIRMDGWQFTRLCGGRPLGAVRPIVIEFEGDAEVGQRIVENLGYVI
ncbi:maleylpyruvate isomerase family mycothiol-dependent enzyme [Mycobacterium sp. CBMA293]|nr:MULTISPECIES: maleylpyruvate isomerase family mycothiol-dependent enzyme [unclassified Mycolicibacterium]MUL57010.1 maleylpyruvate isomerase family mycothiol-dependent enzyme [Mycolicibacterium sp. CBMA 335]MUL70050.1 maleylpyruvate isomerase family mycothiol-dependent enzyme [Mycolicibacterium sp. CBMA 311]MUM10954.1 maleylpyruvate isomerase family mycothiol-dependent enzyme [Mycolicibacterium sp. CBMA 293]MUL46478.1 maleylpyruvate isomerase family mycothiol-dependent enzyme [Mycolicibacter